jgi:hypothetical protein
MHGAGNSCTPSPKGDRQVDKFKAHLLAAFGLLLLLTMFLLGTLRAGNSQITYPYSPLTRLPFQVQLDLTHGTQSFIVPDGQYLVVEYLCATEASTGSVTHFNVETVAGGRAAIYTFPSNTFLASGGGFILTTWSNITARFYADPGSTVTVSGNADSVTISGYMVKSLLTYPWPKFGSSLC